MDGRRRRGQRMEEDEGRFIDDPFEDGMEDEEADAESIGQMDMHELYTSVIEAQSIFPNKIPKPKGLAKLLYPEQAAKPPEYDHHYPFGLQPFDFDVPDDDLRPGHHRPSSVDRLLATSEVHAPIVLAPLGPLASPAAWLDALQLPEASRMRRNPRFLRVLEEYSHPSKYTPDQKGRMLAGLQFGLACDPERAGYEGGVVPFDVPGFNPKELTDGLADEPAPGKKYGRGSQGPGFIDH